MSLNTNIVEKQQAQNNALVNESERANTIVSSIPNYSTFDKSFQQALSFDSGKAIPILLQECYPGDIYSIDASALIRLSAQMSTPFMSINYDISFFYVPYNQLDADFKQLMGENNDYGYSDTNINFPLLNYDNDFEYTENDIATYFNIPINVNMKNDSIQLYPFLAYGKIWNEWYRDQNLQGSIDISTCFNDDRIINSSTYKSSMDFYQSIIFGKGIAPTSKLPSFFTTNLPYQQKGLPINISNFDNALIQGNIVNDLDKTVLFNPKWYRDNGSDLTGRGSNGERVLSYDGATHWSDATNANTKRVDNANMSLKLGDNVKITGDIFPTITDLRYSIVSQHLLENFALCGSRYVEQLKSIWGIEIDPKNINRTELIGGYNDTMIYNNITQTSQTTDNSQLGNISSNLYNQIQNPKVEYACSQHGYIVGILTVRTPINNGGQGLPKLFTHKHYLNLFNPMFNGISEQPTLNQEIYYSSDKEKNKDTFGFNEPFLWTKYNVDNASGFMSLNSKTTLFPKFLFGEKYNETPLLSDNWIRYNPNIIGNTLFNVNESNKEFYHQFVSLLNFNITYTTKQPLFNSPKVYGI